MLLFPEAVRKRWLPDLVSYATGTLLGAAFLGMIPTALDQAATRTVTGTVLAGIVLFFVLEKLRALAPLPRATTASCTAGPRR